MVQFVMQSVITVGQMAISTGTTLSTIFTQKEFCYQNQIAKSKHETVLAADTLTKYTILKGL